MPHQNIGNDILGFNDMAADPTADREEQWNKEERKAYTEGAAQKFVFLRYPGVNPGLNQLRNPSFEVDADGDPPTGWPIVGGAGAEVDDDGPVYDGSKSALILAASAINSFIRQDVAVKKGQYIRASVACNTQTAAHGGLYVKDTTLGALINVKHTGAGGGAWEILSGVYGPMPQDDTILFYLWKWTAGGTDIWFDQAVLQVMDAPVPLLRLRCMDIDLAIPKRPGANPPAEGMEVNFPTLDFDDGVEESVFIAYPIPLDYSPAGAINLSVDFFVDTAPAAPAGVVWGVEYQALTPGTDLFNFGATATITGTEAITIGTPANDKKLHLSSNLILTTAGFVAHDLLLLRLYRDATAGADTFVGDVRLCGIHIEYLADISGNSD